MHKILLQVLPIASAILAYHTIDSYKTNAKTHVVEISSKQTIANINYEREAKLLLPTNSSDRYTAKNSSVGTEADLAAYSHSRDTGSNK